MSSRSRQNREVFSSAPAMTVLYENRRRAKRARLGILGAFVWSLGWLYWAYASNSGGARSGLVGGGILIALLPLVALYFYSSVYVVRIIREQKDVVVTVLGLFGNRDIRIPFTAITEVAAPEVSGLTMRVAGRRMPFILDAQAENGDLKAISDLAKPNIPIES
jgi:hypothetical protein